MTRLKKSFVVFTVIVVMGLCVIPAEAATVTLDQATTYQTIDGFGAFTSMPYLLRRAGEAFWVPRPDTYEIDRLVTSFGATAMRFEIPPEAFPAPGAAYDWNTYVFGTGGLANTVRLMRELKDRGVTRFIASAWSPPCWMKASGECRGPQEASLGSGTFDNYLLQQHYDAFAQFLAEFAQTIKDSVGVELYAISCQNEPYFHQPYNSCVYSGNQLNEIVTLTAQKLQAKGLSTKLFGAEHMFHDGTGTYNALVGNANLYAFAVHGYTDGVSPDYGTAGAWETLKSNVGNKKLWMTETTASTSSYIATAKTLHAALNSGQVSLWTWWAYNDELGTYTQTEGVNTAWQGNGAFVGSSHYFRFIKPDARRIGCTSDQGTLWATAYKNPDNTIAVVLINTGTSIATVDVGGMSATWQIYTSTSILRCQHGGTSGGTGISVPINGIVTAFSGAAVPELGTDTTADFVTAPEPSTVIGELNAHGDDVLELYMNGSLIDFPEGEKSRIVSLHAGENIIACKLVNTGWGGGLIASMHLPNGDTLQTDATWKLSYKEPAAGWTTLAFDDSEWGNATEMGPVDIWPGYTSWGLSAVNFYYQKPKWISGALKTYFRKQVDFPYDRLFVVGNNMKFTLYMDGNVLEPENSQFAGCEEPCHLVQGAFPYLKTGIPSGSHLFALEVEDAARDGNGVLIKMYSGTSVSDITAILDTTWKCWFEEVPGWNQSGFNDAGWINPGVIDAYDTKAPRVPFIYPNTFWYRKKFVSQEAGTFRVTLHGPELNKTAKVELYNLCGQKIIAPARVSNVAGSVMIRRNVQKNGKIVMDRVIRLE